MPHSLCVNFIVEFQFGSISLAPLVLRQKTIGFCCYCLFFFFERQIKLFKNAAYKNARLYSVFGDAGLAADEKLLMRGELCAIKTSTAALSVFEVSCSKEASKESVGVRTGLLSE